MLPADIRVMNGVATALFALAAVALAALVLAGLSRLPMFSLRGIAIDGELGRSSAAAIRANATAELSGNFFSLDLDVARAAFESVPWVRRAVVRRVWPNRLAVTLEEHDAAALWNGDGGSDRIVNRHGEVFDANVGDVEDERLPELSGPDGSASQVLAMHSRLVPLFARIDAEIRTLALSRRGSWRAGLDTGAVIELGRGTGDEIAQRAGRFVRTFAQVDARFERPLEYADLRHGDGYAVRLQGITTSAPPAGAPRRQ
jgi:cell division protein FtsQ